MQPRSKPPAWVTEKWLNQPGSNEYERIATAFFKLAGVAPAHRHEVLRKFNGNEWEMILRVWPGDNGGMAYGRIEKLSDADDVKLRMEAAFGDLTGASTTRVLLLYCKETREVLVCSTTVSRVIDMPAPYRTYPGWITHDVVDNCDRNTPITVCSLDHAIRQVFELPVIELGNRIYNP